MEVSFEYLVLLTKWILLVLALIKILLYSAAFLSSTITDSSGRVLKFQIWDTAGQERYRSLASMYYRNTVAAIVVYDITNYESYEGAKSWIDELRRNENSNSIVVLAGNKTDLPNRAVMTEVS